MRLCLLKASLEIDILRSDEEARGEQRSGHRVHEQRRDEADEVSTQKINF
jgi:hypothetical protein